MKKNSKKYIYALAGLFLILCVFWGFKHYYSISYHNEIVPIAKEYHASNNKIPISLVVSGNTYDFKIQDGSSVYDAMKGLETENKNFSFVSKSYPSLGNFIEEINGIKGTAGKYWIYYVNGKEASIGISKNILHTGDVVTWKQESF